MLMWLLFVGIILVDGCLISYPVLGCVMAFVGTFAEPVKSTALKLRVELCAGAILCFIFGKFAVIRYVWAAVSLWILRSVAVCIKKYETAAHKDCNGAAIMSMWNMYAVLSVIVYTLKFFNHRVLAVLPAILGLLTEIGYMFFLYASVSKITPFPGFKAIMHSMKTTVSGTFHRKERVS